jgi:nitrogen regulatory protein PII 2
MKEIIAIIRPKKVGATRLALEELGFPSQTAIAVLGRGRQRGLVGEVDVELPAEIVAHGGMKFIPKRMLTLVVHNDEVDSIVRAVARVNHTGEIGDGKIFVSPIDDALRVRTHETGESAVL